MIPIDLEKCKGFVLEFKCPSAKACSEAPGSEVER